MKRIRTTLNTHKNKEEISDIQKQIEQAERRNSNTGSTQPNPTPTLSPQQSFKDDNTKKDPFFDLIEYDEVVQRNVKMKRNRETFKIEVKVAFGYKVEVINKTQDSTLKNTAFGGTITLKIPPRPKVAKKKGFDDEDDVNNDEDELSSETFNSSHPIYLKYDEMDDYFEKCYLCFEVNAEYNMEFNFIISQKVYQNSTMSKQLIAIDENRQKIVKLQQGRYYISLKPGNSAASNTSVFLSCCIGTNRRPMVKRMEKGAKDRMEFSIKDETNVVFKIGLESNIGKNRYYDFDQKLNIKDETPFYFILQKAQDDVWTTTWNQYTSEILKRYFIQLLVSYAHQRNDKALKEIERTAKTEHSLRFPSMKSITMYTEKLKSMVQREEYYTRDLTQAILERNINLRLDRLVKSAHQFLNEQFGNDGKLFQSPELQDLIETGNEKVKEIKEERNYVFKLREFLANLWVEVKKKSEEYNEDYVLKKFRTFYDEGKNYPELKSHYYFILETWYNYLSLSITNLEKVQYNCLVFLKENIPREKDFPYMKELASLDTKLKNEKSTLDESDIKARKKAEKLFKSYQYKPIDECLKDYELECQEIPQSNQNEREKEKLRVKSYVNQKRFMEVYYRYEYVFYERILIYIYRGTIYLLSKLREESITDPVELSQAIIDKDIDRIRAKLEESKVLDQNEIRRAQTILINIKNGRDYSELLIDHEKKTIEGAITQFISSNPNLADLITNEMTLLQKLDIIRSKSNIKIYVSEKQGVISPELLFLGESDVVFTPSVHEIPSKRYIAELNETGQKILYYMKKKKDLEPHLGVKEIFIEQTTGMNLKCKSNGSYFTSDIDQYVRKRMLPLIMKILDHQKKQGKEETPAFYIIYKIFKEGGTNYSKKYTNYLMFLKESTSETELWTQTNDNLFTVRLRMLLCFSMNHHKLQKLFSIIFSSPYLREFYKKNSLMRNPDSQKAILQTMENFDKFPFKMIITMERNEYNVDKF